MPTRKLITATGIVIFLFSACVPLPRHQKMEHELEETRSAKGKLETRLKQAEDKIENMDPSLRKCETSKNQYIKETADLRTKNNYLRKINQQLLETIKRLKLDLEKKKSVIQLQGKVIQLLDDTKKTIETSLKDQIAAQEVEVIEEDDTLKVIFVDKILFESGSTEINERGIELLRIMAGSLKDNKDQDILVEGHTDNIPLSAALKKQFPSNWELSAARAAAVVRFFHEQAGIEPERLSARGYSFYRPVASNISKEGRHQNRRIEIILGPGR